LDYDPVIIDLKFAGRTRYIKNITTTTTRAVPRAFLISMVNPPFKVQGSLLKK
jgi:hypothetical protein